MSDIGKLMAPLRRSLGNMIARGVVTAINSATKMQTLQVRLLADESKSDVEHFEPYGFTSSPNPGAEQVALFPDGDRSHGLVIVVADRRYRLQGLAAGEMAIHDDQGQKVHLTREGIVIDGAAKPLLIQNVPTATIKASAKVRMETPLLEITGDIKDRCDANGKTMADMRATYNAHTHPENNAAGGSTSQPNQQM